MSGTNHNMNHIVKRIETRVLAPPGGFSSISFGAAAPTGDVYRGHDFNPKNNKQAPRFPKDSKASAKPPVSHHSTDIRGRGNQASSSQQNILKSNIRRATDLREQNEKENKMKGYANRERRDSLDELIDKPSSGGRCIPGLEGGGNRGTSPSASQGSIQNRGRGQQQSQINKNDYAEILRQQIATKRDLIDDDGFERRHQRGPSGDGGHRAFPQYEYEQDRREPKEQPNRRRGQYQPQQQLQQQAPQQNTTSRRSQYGSGGGQSSISLSWD